MPRLRSDAVTWRDVEGEIVALELASSTYIAINSTGASLWPALVEGASSDELADRLAAAYGLEPEQARSDVEAFLASLRGRGLLEE